jgi:predicted TIM-barrel fold metal-dependent hydrolase
VVAARRAIPVADHHQHLFSPAIVALLTNASMGPRAILARDLVAILDSAGMHHALVLSVAYLYGSPARTVDDEYATVRAENDWAAAQAGRYPERLRAYCSFNPLKAYALDELARCAGSSELGQGIKLHFGNSDVQLDNPEHVEQLRRVFRAANDHRMVIVLHLRPSAPRNRPYGRAQARVFLEQLLPLVPDIHIQVAHLAGAGPGYDDPPADSAMATLAEAVQRQDPLTQSLWFDIATVADPDLSIADAALVASRIRQVGVERILYGSDAAPETTCARTKPGWRSAACRSARRSSRRLRTTWPLISVERAARSRDDDTRWIAPK